MKMVSNGDVLHGSHMECTTLYMSGFCTHPIRNDWCHLIKYIHDSQPRDG